MTSTPPQPPSGAASPDDIVRPMVAADMAEVARLHLAHLPHGFFPKLGARFLRRYYRTFLASPHAVALATGPPGAPAGVLVGVLRPRPHLEWVVRHQGLRLGLAGIAALLVRPRLLGGFIRRRLPHYLKALRSVLRSRRRESDGASASPDQPAGVLSHIVVAPTTQRAGSGALLVEALLAEARRAGLDRVRATTLGGPGGATGFYDRTGWQRRSETRNWDGETIVLYERPTQAGVRLE